MMMGEAKARQPCLGRPFFSSFSLSASDAYFFGGSALFYRFNLNCRGLHRLPPEKWLFSQFQNQYFRYEKIGQPPIA
jgi:hypothetical protein